MITNIKYLEERMLITFSDFQMCLPFGQRRVLSMFQ